MLVYVSRANAIVVLREKTTEGKPERTRVAIIKTPKMKVRFASEAKPTDEEAREVNEFANGLKLASKERKDAILGFASATDHTVKFFATAATDIDKQLIASTIRSAVQATRVRKDAATRAEKPAPPTPEAIAATLHQLLLENVSGRVTGNMSGKKTSVFGSCDLVAVARGLLSAKP
ncbi:hypothetical protein [Reyranella sp.]|jgi:hypothetical protein|uniref:hypothetical protein n=1 Tax=Reyranella sp. TaxID=1929291 RepID=UPI000BDBF82B|nr:hypothetical protein [Reyranella sp.]OYY44869.1 MAG: hypothetical protein B7Y57_07035 [Rhodospirillales bacterium 35-66-84]OYZ95293.1 MAG: hypothetical protein B7Y08_08205 [Rhodospirillales bacterium 24-66-33]OZB26932.1 MAG: hypothetical protein B7X63_07385 [Rhodospirillales bacterium 39-66-50]HQS16037.1 hypothetical protein [Reyranella sp.]HQT11717.1 hypothetical protein [Reyranella sp.]